VDFLNSKAMNQRVVGLFILLIIFALSVTTCGDRGPDAPENVMRVLVTHVPLPPLD
jgi:hypothetical protein